MAAKYSDDEDDIGQDNQLSEQRERGQQWLQEQQWQPEQQQPQVCYDDLERDSQDSERAEQDPPWLQEQELLAEEEWLREQQWMQANYDDDPDIPDIDSEEAADIALHNELWLEEEERAQQQRQVCYLLYTCTLFRLSELGHCLARLL